MKNTIYGSSSSYFVATPLTFGDDNDPVQDSLTKSRGDQNQETD